MYFLITAEPFPLIEKIISFLCCKPSSAVNIRQHFDISSSPEWIGLESDLVKPCVRFNKITNPVNPRVWEMNAHQFFLIQYTISLTIPRTFRQFQFFSESCDVRNLKKWHLKNELWLVYSLNWYRTQHHYFSHL